MARASKAATDTANSTAGLTDMPTEDTVDWKTVRANMVKLPKGSRPKATRNRSGRPMDDDTLGFATDIRESYEQQTDGYLDVPGNTVTALISKFRRAARHVDLGVSFLMEDPYTNVQYPQHKDTVYPELTRVWYTGVEFKPTGPRKGNADAESATEE